MDRDSLRHPASWLLALSGATLYVWAPTTVPAQSLASDPVLPAWLGLVAPPLLYGLLLAGFPRVPVARRLAGVAALCLGHALLSFATPLFYGATGILPPARAEAHALWAYPAAALVQLLAVPLVAFPLRGLLARSRGRSRQRGVRRTSTPPPTRPAAIWDVDAGRTVGGERLREDTPRGEITPEWRRTTLTARPAAEPTPRPRVTRTPTPPPVTPGARPAGTAPAAAERRGLFEVPATPALESPPPAPVRAEPSPRPAPPAPPPTATPVASGARPAEAAPRAPIALDAVLAELESEAMRLLEMARTPIVEPPPAPMPKGAVAPPAIPAPVEPEIASAPPAAVVAPSPTPAPPPPGPIEPVWATPRLAAELPATEPEPGPEHAAEIQRIAELLRRAGPLETSVHTLMGTTLFTVCSPRLAREAVVQSAFRLVSFAAGSARPMSQVTLRGSSGAMVLTPLGPLRAGGPVVVAAVPNRGVVALLEILSRCAAAEYRITHPAAAAASGPSSDRDGNNADLAEAPVPPRLDALARSMTACGPLAPPRALQDRTGRVLLYLLLPSGVDGNEVGRIARDLYEVMGADEDPGGLGPIQSLVLRVGSQRIIVKPASEAPGRSTLLVAAGGEDRPGLAKMEVERVAARLGAAS